MKPASVRWALKREAGGVSGATGYLLHERQAGFFREKRKGGGRPLVHNGVMKSLPFALGRGS